MTELSYPSADLVPDVPDEHSIATAKKWSNMARWFNGSGVHRGDRNELVVRPSASRYEVTLDTGSASLLGIHYDNTTPVVFAVPAADPSKDRYDRLVCRLTFSGDTAEAHAVVKTGTPGAGGTNDPAYALTQTDDVFEIELGNWLAKKGSGILTPGDDSQIDRFGYAQQPVLASNILPGPDPTRQVGSSILLIDDGAPAGPVGSSSRWIWDGDEWCIEPGQLLVYKTFQDGGQRLYNAIYAIGDARYNDGAVSGQVQWTPPKCLPGHGFEIYLHAMPFTVGGTVSDAIQIGLYNQTRTPGPQGAPAHGQVGGQYGANYNSSLDVTNFFPGTDPVMSVPDQQASIIPYGFCPNGTVRFVEGILSIKAV